MPCRPFVLAAASLSMALLTTAPALAQTVLEKVAKTGVLVGGTSKDAFPFAFRDEQKQLVGYSIDMMQLVKAQLEKELQRPITLELVALDPDERIPKLQMGEVDLVCDASSFTWERDKEVDFSVSYGLTGTRLLVKNDSEIWDPASLAGKRVGALPKTTNELAIRKAQPKVEVVLISDRAAGYAALTEGKIDAFADDGVLLTSWQQRSPNAKDYQVVGYPYSQEGIACMLPENNSTLQGAVDLALVRYMQGFLAQKPAYTAIFDRWFGPQGASPLTQDLRNLVTETMQLVLDFKQELPEDEI